MILHLQNKLYIVEYKFQFILIHEIYLASFAQLRHGEKKNSDAISNPSGSKFSKRSATFS